MHTQPVLAFDIGGTHLRGAIVDREGKVLVDGRLPSSGLSVEQLVERAATLAAELEQRAGLRVERVGAGVAAMLPLPGEVIENAPNLGWRNAPLRQLLADALGGRLVRLYNDVDASAYGETAHGAARGFHDVICVFVGTGVGSGIISGGRLVRGHRGVAAEFGHIKIATQGGRPCGCGATGCLEAYTGGAALLTRIAAAVADGSAPDVAARAAGEVATVAHVDAAAAAGDPFAVALWDEVGTHLALALANLVTVLNPARLVLGGGVLARAPGLLARVKDGVGRYTNAVALTGFEIVDVGLGDDGGLIGAAALVRALEV
ncbi:MAG: ROK family protein [Myxococcota bacterium]